MAIETTPPSESTPEPEAADHIALSGTITTRGSMAGNITVSDTPLPARPEADAAILSNWYQPLSQAPPRPAFVIDGGAALPPFPPPVHADVPIIGVEATAEVGAVVVGQAAGVGVAEAEGASIAEGVGVAKGVRTFGLNAEPGRYTIGTEPSLVRASLVSADSSGRYTLGAEPSILRTFDAKQARFDRLEARVALLEATLLRPPGVGHNHGPYLDDALSVDEAGIQNLISLLKEQHATAPVDLAKLTEAAKIADPAINNWRERIDQFVSGVLKGAGFVAGKEIIEQLAHTSWVQSVYSALQSVFEALMSWLALF
jgi:hypothetical protein